MQEKRFHHQGTKTPRKDKRKTFLQEETEVTETDRPMLLPLSVASVTSCSNYWLFVFPWCLGALVVNLPAEPRDASIERTFGQARAELCGRRLFFPLDGEWMDFDFKRRFAASHVEQPQEPVADAIDFSRHGSPAFYHVLPPWFVAVENVLDRWSSMRRRGNGKLAACPTTVRLSQRRASCQLAFSKRG
jgi:hypothetical protein